MCIQEAVSLGLQAGALGKGGEIFILDMGEQVKIVDLATNLIALSGLKLNTDISIKFVGLRDAEKLSEELLLNTEKNQVTKNKKIFVTNPSSFDSRLLRKQVKELEKYANRMDERIVLKKLKEIIK
jgi:FlaA1/EpsC-like NDP-sugar epimerase